MVAVMSDEVRYSPGLFRGTAEYYDRFRLSYPEAMISDLVRRTGASGRGRLLDLACGTGQLAFALQSSFAEVWAVDQEPDMVDVVQAKAAAAGAGEVRPVVSSAEYLDADPGSFELAVIGNAFHRLDPPGLRLAPAGRVPGAVLVDLTVDRRARLAAGARDLHAQVAGGSRGREPGTCGLGPGPQAPA